ncbi:MAG TPA: hypothetical protein VLI92_03330 [Candidatus Saccharimonadales bacterium]|nr:hypothetical protein [Candidatus Saccharimonadales bacterium]
MTAHVVTTADTPETLTKILPRGTPVHITSTGSANINIHMHLSVGRFYLDNNVLKMLLYDEEAEEVVYDIPAGCKIGS